MAPPKLIGQSTQEFMRVRLTRQDDAESPGGRAKLRLSRGFPGCLACDVTPYGMSRLID